MIDTAALREKVLDLAIRGKLVPQDPNDEPASVLLERIHEQKLQMVREGKLKAKDVKDDTIIFKGDDNCYYEKYSDGSVKNIQDEIPFDLPVSWAWSRISSIGTTNIGLTYKPTDIASYGTIVLRSSNIKNSQIDLSDLVRVKTIVRENQLVEHNDIVICARNGSKALVGKCAIFNMDLGENVSFGAFMAILRTDCYNYVYYFLNTNLFRQVLNSDDTKQINQLTQDMLKRTIVPIPPQDEQERIVSLLNQITTQLTLINDYYADIDILQQIIQKKILELAIQGKLVPQDESDEPASVLLERIRTERKAKLGKKYIESYIYKGDDNCYYEKVGKNSVDITENISFEIPPTWEICRFESIVEMYTGNSINESDKAKKYMGLSDGYNYIATKDISFNHNVNYENGIKIPFDESKFKIAYKGDPLLCIEGGSAGRKIAILSEDVCFVNKLCVFHSLGVNKKYLYYYLQSPQFCELFKKNTSGLIGGVSINTLKSLYFMLPPLFEQLRIVCAIEEIFSYINEIEKGLV